MISSYLRRKKCRLQFFSREVSDTYVAGENLAIAVFYLDKSSSILELNINFIPVDVKI